jgi:hypothetical protein
MKGVLIFIGGLLLGGIAGVIGGGALGLGAGAGVGIVTGLKAGACLTLEAAREEGLISAEQESELLAAAARQLASEDLPEGPDTTEIDCAKVVADLRQAAEERGAE